MLFSDALFWVFFEEKYFLHIAEKVIERMEKYFQNRRQKKKTHKNSVMSVYMHMRHFLVLVMLSQILCLMLVILSVALKSYKEVQHVQSF